MSHMHVVYGYHNGQAPVGDAPIQGFGRSDRAALADAERNRWTVTNAPVNFYFIRSNGDRVPAPPALSTVSAAKRAHLRRWKGVR